jgi:hypothetical protein
MPLTAKGEKIKAALQKEYGAEKGERVLYAGRNSGTFAGVDGDPIDRYMDAVRRGDAETMRSAFADGGAKKR